MKNILDALNWRYATKAFDTNKKVAEKDLETIQEAFRLTASSYGLQPWKLVVVENKDLRGKLVEHSWGQRQVVDASHLLVLCRPIKFTLDSIDTYIKSISETRWVPKENLEGYENMMKWALGNLDEATINAWMEKQVYIALWNMMTVCAQMEIDSCPMEGFVHAKYDEILWLTELGLTSVVLLPIWYRSEKDGYAHTAKVRFNEKDIIVTL